MPANQSLLWQRMAWQISIARSSKTVLPRVNWDFNTEWITHAWEWNNHPSIYEAHYSWQNLHGTPRHQQMSWTGPTVCMVAWLGKTIGRVDQKLSRMLSCTKATSATTNHISISWTSMAKGCHRSIRVEKQKLFIDHWLLFVLYRNLSFETNYSRGSNQTHKKHIC